MAEFYDFGEWLKQGYEMWKKLYEDEYFTFRTEVDGEMRTVHLDLNMLTENQKNQLFQRLVQDGCA